MVQPAEAPPAALPDLESLPLPALLDALIAPVDLAGLVTRALAEDLGAQGDVTTQALVPPGTRARAVVRARRAGVIAGVPVALETLRQGAPGVRASVHRQDGERVEAGDTVLALEGPLAPLLGAERTLLNALGHLSGVATATATCADAVASTRARICATRKTTPGLRALEKYAVRCGGGLPHRMGLDDALLVKDNHIAGLAPSEAAERVRVAAIAARGRWRLRFVMVECDTLEQVDAMLALPPGLVDILLLDNMPPETLRAAVNRRDHAGSAVRLEASGGVALATVRAIAETGVDRISVGAITQSAAALDVGLDVESTDPAA